MGGSSRRLGRAGRGAAAALAHVVADVSPLAARVADVVLGLIEVAVHVRSGVDERVIAFLVCG